MRDRNNNIILTGFMGSGKTTAGIRLSYRLRLPLLDTDKWIEKKKAEPSPKSLPSREKRPSEKWKHRP